MNEANLNTNHTEIPVISSFRDPVATANSYLSQMNCLIDYEWPIGSNNFYFIQNHVGRYLNIKSLHRKFSDLDRRVVTMEEKDHLLARNIISSMEYDFGMVALCKNNVTDLMIECFPQLYLNYLHSLCDHKHQVANICQSIFHKSIQKEKEISVINSECIRASRYNRELNNLRSTKRKYWVSLEGSVLYGPRKYKKLSTSKYKNCVSTYPVALLPCQYQDHVITYLPEQLDKFPLKSVIVNDFTEEFSLPSAIKSYTEGNDSKKINDSNGPEKKVEENYGENDTEICNSCGLGNSKSISSLIQCVKCKNYHHTSCSGISEKMVETVKASNWSCYDCKVCEKCQGQEEDEKIIFCDFCDSAYHSYCVDLEEIPIGRWICNICGGCTSCCARRPGSQGWIREQVNVKGKNIFLQIHCSPCSRLFRDEKFCPVCLIVHSTKIENNEETIKCLSCDYLIHKSCFGKNQNKCTVCLQIVEDRAGILKKLVEKKLKSN